MKRILTNAEAGVTAKALSVAAQLYRQETQTAYNLGRWRDEAACAELADEVQSLADELVPRGMR